MSLRRTRHTVLLAKRIMTSVEVAVNAGRKVILGGVSYWDVEVDHGGKTSAKGSLDDVVATVLRRPT